METILIGFGIKKVEISRDVRFNKEFLLNFTVKASSKILPLVLGASAEYLLRFFGPFAISLWYLIISSHCLGSSHFMSLSSAFFWTLSSDDWLVLLSSSELFKTSSYGWCRSALHWQRWLISFWEIFPWQLVNFSSSLWRTISCFLSSSLYQSVAHGCSLSLLWSRDSWLKQSQWSHQFHFWFLVGSLS